MTDLGDTRPGIQPGRSLSFSYGVAQESTERPPEH